MKTKFKLIVSLAFLCFFLSNGQKINDNWFFGNKASLNFSTGGPISGNSSQMNTYEGTAAISDEFGQLLFYTDGRRVLNKNHSVMQNGSGLSGSGITFIQGVIILPYPNNFNEYLIFTTNGNPSSNIVAYSKVDMSRNNGLGAVVEKNIPLLNENGNTSWDYNIEAITSVNNNDENYWVLIPYGDKLYSYKVDDSGVNTTPYESQITNVGNTATSKLNSLKVSPDKSLLGITQFFEKKASIYNFDSNTGKVIGQPLVVFNSNTQIYSLEYSDDSSIAWFSGFFDIFGQDLNNLQSPPVVISSSEEFGSIQKGVNNVIYISRPNSDYLSSIDNYNDLNSARLNLNSVYLGGNKSLLGLPQLVPLLEKNGNCIPSIILSNPEANNSFLYEASNYIETNGNYKISPNQNIRFEAGNYIEMLPGTEVIENSIFEAYIEDCSLFKKAKKEKRNETQYVYLDSGNDLNAPLDENQINIYPNPASDNLNITVQKSMLNKELIVEVYDLLGKRITRENINKLKSYMNISKWNRGVYVIKISSTHKNTIITKRIMKL